MKFYLGSHHPSWLGTVNVPLFVSCRTLAGRKTLPRAQAPWALDSGGFSELSMYGEWRTSPETYVTEVRRYRDEIGNLAWAAPQDWMCEPWLLSKTGLSIREHQARTVSNFVALRDAAPDLPFIPVLQGWAVADYLTHVAMYERAGVDLRGTLVGLGSVCRRQNTLEAKLLVHVLATTGLRLHGFGFKLTGLQAIGHKLESADSLAWSYDARRSPAMAGHSHKSCANCVEYALCWREKALASIAAPKQEVLL